MSKRVAFSFPPLYEGGRTRDYVEYWDKSSYFCIECGTKGLWERSYAMEQDNPEFFCAHCGTDFETVEGVYTNPNNAIHKARTEQLLKED